MTDRTDFENAVEADRGLSSEELQRILTLQGRILNQAVVNEDDDELLNELCLLAESYTPNAVAAIMLYDEDDDQILRVSNGPSLPQEAIDAFCGLRVGDGSCGNAIYHNEPMYVSNTFEDARWRSLTEVARRFNICACFAFPIRDARSQPIGSFSISSFEHRSASGFQRALLETCTSICGVILQRRRDREARRNVLEEQIKAMKLESLGILAGGIAHDFNNLLGSILGSIDLAMVDISDERVKETLKDAVSAIDRAAGLTHQLLTFSRGGTPVKTPTDIEAILRESAEFALHGSSVALHIETLTDEEPKIFNVDSGQIGQVIQNLVLNSSQAMPDGGRIDVHCRTVDQTDHDVLSTGRYLKICVRDNGPGIPEALIKKVFDPYFTTRDEGTGLGLSICHSIVKNHQGHLLVDSSDTGTCFTIYLPAGTSAELQIKAEPPQSNRLVKRRVLLLDDDDLVLRTATKMLTQLGCDVLQARDGSEVLPLHEQAERDGRPIDLTILDLTIRGGMGGLEAKTKLLARFPDASVVVSTGFSADHIVSDYRSHGFKGVLAKPYRISDLKRVCGGVFSRAAS